MEVVLVGVGAGGSPADDGCCHREPPPHAHQTHPEPDGRGTKEMLEDVEVDCFSRLEKNREEQDQSRAEELHGGSDGCRFLAPKFIPQTDMLQWGPPVSTELSQDYFYFHLYSFSQTLTTSP